MHELFPLSTNVDHDGCVPRSDMVSASPFASVAVTVTVKNESSVPFCVPGFCTTGALFGVLPVIVPAIPPNPWKVQ